MVPRDCPETATDAEYVATLRVTTGGRITIPKAVRDGFGLKGGETLNYVKQPDGSYLVELAPS
jgi:AbrB family looped-hinge helix DNA binding protein